jgi:hypothetical protein
MAVCQPLLQVFPTRCADGDDDEPVQLRVGELARIVFNKSTSEPTGFRVRTKGGTIFEVVATESVTFKFTPGADIELAEIFDPGEFVPGNGPVERPRSEVN